MARILIGNIKGPTGATGPKGATGATGPAGPQGPLPPLTNNGLATVAGVSALDAAYGKTLTDKATVLQTAVDALNGDKLSKNRITGFTVEVQLTNGSGNLVYSAAGLDGSGFCVIFSNDSTLYVRPSKVTKNGCNVAIYNPDMTLYTNPSIWLTGIVIVTW